MRHPLAALTFVLAGALAGPAVRAQTCEQFRDTLAGRVDPAIRGFSMEIVPGSAPVPPGAKVFGSCEGGARKILFFRNGRPAGMGESDAATPVAAAPSAAKPSAAAPAATPPSAAMARAKVALPTTSTASAARVASAPAAPAPGKPVERPPAPTIPPRVESPRAPAPVTAVASEAASWPALRTVTEPTSAAASGGEASASTEPGLLRRIAPWLAGAAGLVIALLLWGWVAHRRAYDASGLPRGPRLKP